MLLLQLTVAARGRWQPNFRAICQRWHDWWWAEIDYPLNTRYCGVRPPAGCARQGQQPAARGQPIIQM